MQLLLLGVIFVLGQPGNTLRLPSTEKMLQRLEQRLDAKISNLEDQIKLESKQLREDISLIFENLIDFEDKIKLLLPKQSDDDQGVGKIGDKSSDTRYQDDRFKRIDDRMDEFELALNKEKDLKEKLMDTMKTINTAVSLMSDDIGEIRDNLEELGVGQNSSQQSIDEVVEKLTYIEQRFDANDTKTAETKVDLKSLQQNIIVSGHKVEKMQTDLKTTARIVNEVRKKTVEIKGRVDFVGHIVQKFEGNLYNYSREVGKQNSNFCDRMIESENQVAAKMDYTSHAVKNLTNFNSKSFEDIQENTKKILDQCLARKDLERAGNLKLENHFAHLGAFLNETINSCLQAPSSPVESTHRSCRDGVTRSGVYNIQLPSFPIFKAYCDMDTDGGGWMVFQRRKDGSVDFYRNWADYKRGFGDLSGEFWLGNDIIHKLTSTPQKLRIDLWDWDGSIKYANYRFFSIGPESDKYRLQFGAYSGNAGDSLGYHNGSRFSTKDQNNCLYDHYNCAEKAQGAWWYKNCAYSSLNGHYYPQAKFSGDQHAGLMWFYYAQRYGHSLKGSEMKIRPK